MRSQNIKVNNVGRAGCFGLLALGLMLANPVSGLAFAEEDSEEAGVPAVQSAELVTSAVQIAFDEPVGVSSLTPISMEGASALYSVKATVDVANSGGYTVYLGSSKAELIGKKSGATINGVTSSTSYEGMPVNSWGYSFAEGETAGTTFSALPANVRGVVLGGNNSANIKTDRKIFTLSFAAHIGNDKPADTYENEVTMSVVSSPREVAGLTELVNMQDMTSAICAASEVGDAAQLKDVRDGKYYWVSKLADNNCWMTQNLDLDLNVDTLPLTAATSDVESGWMPIFDGEILYTAEVANAETVLANNLGQRSWSLGDYRLADPDISNDCGYPKNSAADCSAQFISYTTPMSANGDVDAHYILGNHYQWNAATAGTGGAMTEGQAESSICPKGWRLPTSDAGGEFGELVTALGGTSNTDNVTKLPFYGVRGGNVDQNVNYLFRSSGNEGYYWSSSPFSTADVAYVFGFWSANDVSPSSYHKRQYGFSVRCVAR